MDYTGWTLYDKVTIVVSERENKYKYPKAYIVNTKDKNQLASAMHWAEYNRAIRGENGELIKDKNGNATYETVKADVFETENKGFKVKLLDCAGSSTQGGKLSFWNCVVTKEGLGTYIVGIDSSLLLQVLLQNTFVNGECSSELCFARCSGGLGLLNENMSAYSDAVRDMDTKKEMSRGKTKKWKVGYNYLTLTTNEVYLGEFYKPLQFKENYSRGGFYNREIDISIIKNTEKIFLTDDRLNSKYDTKQYFNNVIKEIHNLEAIENTKQSSDLVSAYCDAFSPYVGSYAFMSKIPSRKEDTKVFEVLDNYYDKIQNILELLKKNIIRLLKDRSDFTLPIYRLNNLLLSTYYYDDQHIPDIDKELIRLTFDKLQSTSRSNKINISKEIKNLIEN